MLSIARMGSGSANYYVALAREDYYLAGGEPPGLWAGRGAARLGLQGTVEEQAFRHVFAGFSPDRSQKLVQNAGEDRHPGWDLTFSAPKSVSVLWSQTDPVSRAKIEWAVVQASRDALGYLEDTAVFTRRGRGGATVEKGEGMVAALYLHGTSRSQDPQLHVHGLVMNVVPRADGSWGAMLGITSSARSEDRLGTRSPLFAEKMTAGALFRASLSSRLTELGLEVERTATAFELAGVPPKLMARFSTRSKEIAEELRALGGSGPKEKERAALLTREKKARVAREMLFERWQEAGRGFELSSLLDNRQQSTNGPSLTEVVKQATARLEHQSPEFTRGEFIRAVATESIGHRVSVKEIRLASERFLDAYPRVSESPPTYMTPRTEATYSALATRLESMARRRGVGRAREKQVRAAETSLERQGSPLSPAARIAVRALTSARNRLRVLGGLRSRESLGAMEAARRAWEAQGYKVVGVSPTVRRARAIQALTGIRTHTPQSLKQSQKPKTHLQTFKIVRAAGRDGRIRFRSLAGFLAYAGKVKRTPWVTLDRDTVLVIDSPGKMDPIELRRLVAEANRNGSTVVLTNTPQTQSSQLGAVTQRLAAAQEQRTSQSRSRGQSQGQGQGY